MDKTLPLSGGSHHPGRDGSEVPGVVVVFTGGGSLIRVLPLAAGPLELGRGDEGAGKLDDGRVSRLHARVAVREGRCTVTDLGSQNGTFVDGALATAHTATMVERVIRVGDTLLVPCADVRSLEARGVRTIDGFVRGPQMQEVLDEVARAAHGGPTLHVRGESGTGKEAVAQAFHRAGPRAARPLVAVNCAAIPHALAERLLFGAKRGTYSGADADAAGYVQEADGSTLFLDEIAELDPLVQAKLLRVLEAREVLPLGASRPRKVDFALCSATSKDLRALVAAGTLREDLYFRVGSPAVTLPALRNRPLEIPALIAGALAGLPQAPKPHVSLVERCLLLPWPGNVRELLAEVRTAAHAALRDGQRVEARHLPATAGTVFGSAALTASPDEPRKRLSRDDVEWRQRIEEALRTHGGNIAAAARALGLHRTQLRRLIARYGSAVAGAADDEPAD